MPTFEILSVTGNEFSVVDLDTGESYGATNAGTIEPLVGQVAHGEVIADDDESLIEFVSVEGTLVIPKIVGAAGNRKARIGNKDLSLTQIGGVTDQLAQRLCNGTRRFILSDPERTPAGRWLGVSSVSEWETGLETENQTKVAELFVSGLTSKFVNPYTFVPWPEEDPQTQLKPAGHDALVPGRFSGSLQVTGTTLTPLLIRGGAAPQTFPRRKRRKPDGTVVGELMIAGSGLKGAIRSLHETLAGGCLRVVDTEYLPVYRETPVVKGPLWRMAIVDQIDHYGIPRTVTLCDDVVHVNQEHLRNVLGGVHNVVTGARINVDTVNTTVVHQSKRANESAVTQGNDWVVLITDSAARDFKNHPKYYAAVGHISTQTATVSTDAWEKFEKAVSGARDTSTGQQNHSSTAPVNWPPRSNDTIGTRTRARKDLHPGDVIWAEVEGANTPAATVKRINLSYLWRVRGEQNLGTRIPPWAKPCSHADQLCVSCRLFGSADTDANHDEDQAEQESYAGHVRIGDSVFASTSTTQILNLGPLGEPRLGAGQFSLQNPPGNHQAANQQAMPARNWGSALDPVANPRLLRGRKYYWQGDPARQNPPRFAPYSDGRGAQNMEGFAETVSPGNTFLAVVHFENLSLAELGGLVAAIDPSMVLVPKRPTIDQTEVAIPNTENPKIAGRIGGGKPFGFGAVDMTVELVTMHTAASRYLGEAEPELALQSAIDAFVRGVAPAVKDTWPDLAACLQMHHVDPTKIAYPPADSWAGRHRAAYAKKFWKQSNGDDQSIMVSLPGPPRNADQYLTIVPGH
jgi:CRISPR-associated protein (TIGR03986 family)